MSERDYIEDKDVADGKETNDTFLPNENTHELTLGVSYSSNSVAVCPASSIP